jgi:hypothetical protein
MAETGNPGDESVILDSPECASAVERTTAREMQMFKTFIFNVGEI